MAACHTGENEEAYNMYIIIFFLSINFFLFFKRRFNACVTTVYVELIMGLREGVQPKNIVIDTKSSEHNHHCAGKIYQRAHIQA